MKKLNLEQTKQEIIGIIARYTEQFNIYNIILNHIKTNINKYEGKIITKRLETNLKKIDSLKDYTLYLNNQYNLLKITIWKGNLNNRIDIHLPHSIMEKIPFTLSKFEENNRCYSLNKDRIKVLKSSLNTLKREISKINNLVNKYEELKENSPDELRYILF